MVSGTVIAAREAKIWLRFTGTSGIILDIEAVIDTGFTSACALPRDCVDALGLSQVMTDEVTLADGCSVPADVFEGTVLWHGEERTVGVHCLEGGALAGMGLLVDCRLVMDIVDGGAVTIRPLSGEAEE